MPEAADGSQFAELSFSCLEGREDAAIAESLGSEVAASFGPRNEESFSILARDPAGALVGGANGATHWSWLYLRHLFVSQPWRGRGLGRRLMQEVEDLALRRGCAGLYLDSFDPRAVAFYLRLGFQVYGRLEDFPPGHRRTFLFKRIKEL